MSQIGSSPMGASYPSNPGYFGGGAPGAGPAMSPNGSAPGMPSPGGAPGIPPGTPGTPPGNGLPPGAQKPPSPTVQALSAIEDFLQQIKTRLEIASNAGKKSEQEGSQSIAALLKGGSGNA